jgi:hypothetical protein
MSRKLPFAEIIILAFYFLSYSDDKVFCEGKPELDSSTQKKLMNSHRDEFNIPEEVFSIDSCLYNVKYDLNMRLRESKNLRNTGIAVIVCGGLLVPCLWGIKQLGGPDSKGQQDIVTAGYICVPLFAVGGIIMFFNGNSKTNALNKKGKSIYVEFRNRYGIQ